MTKTDSMTKRRPIKYQQKSGRCNDDTGLRVGFREGDHGSRGGER
jgi:hypothetical protein